MFSLLKNTPGSGAKKNLLFLLPALSSFTTVYADQCGWGMWLFTPITPQFSPQFTPISAGQGGSSGADGYGACIPAKTWYFNPESLPTGFECNSETNKICNSRNGTMVEIFGTPSVNGDPDVGTSVGTNLASAINQNWSDNPAPSISQILCGGGAEGPAGKWTIHSKWAHVWPFHPSTGTGYRFICHGDVVPPKPKECPNAFVITSFAPGTDEAGQPSKVPTGAMGAEFEQCLPADQQWQPGVTTSQTVSTELTWSDSTTLGASTSITFKSPQVWVVPQMKWNVTFSANHTWSNGGSTSQSETFTVTDNFNFGTSKDDRYIHLVADQISYKYKVSLKGHSGCCGMSGYDQTGCPGHGDGKPVAVPGAEIQVFYSSNTINDATRFCIERDPWASSKNANQDADPRCQTSTDSWPGRDHYKGCYDGGVRAADLENCDKTCKTGFIFHWSYATCTDRVATAYNNQTGTKNLDQAIASVEKVCASCLCTSKMFPFGHGDKEEDEKLRRREEETAGGGKKNKFLQSFSAATK